MKKKKKWSNACNLPSLFCFPNSTHTFLVGLVGNYPTRKKIVIPKVVPSLKLTACTWKWMVRRQAVPFGAWPIFRGELSVSGSVVLNLGDPNLLKFEPPQVFSTLPIPGTAMKSWTWFADVWNLGFFQVYIHSYLHRKKKQGSLRLLSCNLTVFQVFFLVFLKIAIQYEAKKRYISQGFGI